MSVRVTQIGSWPGTDHALALRIACDELPDQLVLPELPARGPHAGMIGRATALLSGLSVDLQPAGWRLIHGAARDHQRARQLLRDDLERLEEQCARAEETGWSRQVKIGVTGPWTLAASLDLPMGEKVVADSGARRDLADSLTEGVAELRNELARRIAGAEITIQLDEPMLPLVTAGEVRTQSGLHRYRPVDEPELTRPLSAIAAQGPTWLHCCAAEVPYRWLARVPGLSLALDEALITNEGWDVLGEQLDAGTSGCWGISGAQGPDAIAQKVLRRLDRLGLGPEVSGLLWLSPACGLAGETEANAVRILRQLRTAAGIIDESLAS